MLALSLLACSSTTATPVGPIGSVTLPLPEGVEKPAKLEEHTGKVKVCASDDFDPAEVEFTWTAFRVEGDSHVVDVAAAIVAEGPNLEVAMTIDPEPASSSLEQGEWKGLANVTFDCHRQASKGCKQYDQKLVDMVWVTGEGEAKLNRGP